MAVSTVLLVVLASVCAIKAVRATHLLHAALWLAGVSGVVTMMLYMVGAYPLAVIELSLSVGLITIFLVFAISMVGADVPDIPVARWMNWPLVIAMLLLVIGLTMPLLSPPTDQSQPAFTVTFWQQREADVVAQLALIFAGVLGVLGLLTEVKRGKPARQQPTTEKADDRLPFRRIPEEDAELEKV